MTGLPMLESVYVGVHVFGEGSDWAADMERRTLTTGGRCRTGDPRKSHSEERRRTVMVLVLASASPRASMR